MTCKLPGQYGFASDSINLWLQLWAYLANIIFIGSNPSLESLVVGSARVRLNLSLQECLPLLVPIGVLLDYMSKIKSTQRHTNWPSCSNSSPDCSAFQSVRTNLSITDLLAPVHLINGRIASSKGQAKYRHLYCHTNYIGLVESPEFRDRGRFS